MKKWKKGIALLTVCILMISMAAGCGATGQKENETDDPAGTAKGRFVESEVDLPEKIQTVCAVGRSENGEITLLGYGDETFYLAHGSGQGDDWSQKKIKSFEGGYANAVNGEDGSAVWKRKKGETGSADISEGSRQRKFYHIRGVCQQPAICHGSE